MNNSTVRILSIVLILCIICTALVACNNVTNSLTLYVNDGIAALSVATLLDNNIVDSIAVDVSIVSTNAVNIAVTNSSVDMAILPIDTGASIYNDNGNYQLVSICNFGSMYVLSANGIITMDKLVGNVVYCTKQDAMTQYIVETILDNRDISYVQSSQQVSGSVALKYMSSQEDIVNALSLGIIDYAIIEEPYVSIAVEQCSNNNITLDIAIDIGQEWGLYSSSNSYGYVQYGLFVSKDIIENNEQFVNNLCLALSYNSTYVQDNVYSAQALLISYGSTILDNITFDSQFISRCNLTQMYASKYIGDIYSLLDMLYECDSSIIGGAVPDSGFVYLYNAD